MGSAVFALVVASGIEGEFGKGITGVREHGWCLYMPRVKVLDPVLGRYFKVTLLGLWKVGLPSVKPAGPYFGLAGIARPYPEPGSGKPALYNLLAPHHVKTTTERPGIASFC